MNDSATNTMATVPIAKASGAAAPAACTTKVMLKAAVTVGQMTETDKPMASGRLKRLTSFVMSILVSHPRPPRARLVCGSLFPGQAGNLLQQTLGGDLAAIPAVIAQ